MWGYKTQRIKVGRNKKHMDIHKAIWLLDDTVVAGKPLWQWTRMMLLEWRMKERMGYRLIADRLIRVGIPTPSGKAGSLSNDELDDIRQAYADGCSGEILIGMSGEKRVITMLLPAHTHPEELLSHHTELRKLGCDRWIRVYRK